MMASMTLTTRWFGLLLLAAAGLAACAAPTGDAVPECDASWAEVQPSILVASDGDAEPMPIACMSPIDDRRIRIGFFLPAGPTCHALSALDIVESADAVSVRIGVEPLHDPLAGACPDEPMRAMTEADLQAPVGDRELLDSGT